MRPLLFLVSVPFCAGCWAAPDLHAADQPGPTPGVYTGTLSRVIVSQPTLALPTDAGTDAPPDCSSPPPPYAKGSFVVIAANDFGGALDLGLQIRLGLDGGGCSVSGAGGTLADVPPACAEAPEGYAFVSGLLDFAPSSPATAVELSWQNAAGDCLVRDTWGLTQ